MAKCAAGPGTARSSMNWILVHGSTSTLSCIRRFCAESHAILFHLALSNPALRSVRLSVSLSLSLFLSAKQPSPGGWRRRWRWWWWWWSVPSSCSSTSTHAVALRTTGLGHRAAVCSVRSFVVRKRKKSSYLEFYPTLFWPSKNCVHHARFHRGMYIHIAPSSTFISYIYYTRVYHNTKMKNRQFFLGRSLNPELSLRTCNKHYSLSLQNK